MRRLIALGFAITLACAGIGLAVSSLGSSTTAAAAAAPPAATTGAAANVAQSSVRLSGTVNPAGSRTHYFFQYGPTTGYGANTPSTTAGAGTSNVAAAANLTGLASGTTFHYRLVAVSNVGTATGADQTFTTTTPSTSSQAVILGREGFVSPGRVVGVELGCFHGTTSCSGHLTMSNDGTVIAQRNYSIGADSGGFQNMKLTGFGANLLKGNHVFHLLPVTVTAAGSDGQKLTFTIHLARWVWH